MTISSVIFISLGVAALAITTSAYAFAPEKYQIEWKEMAGWACFIASWIFWGLK